MADENTEDERIKKGTVVSNMKTTKIMDEFLRYIETQDVATNADALSLKGGATRQHSKERKWNNKIKLLLTFLTRMFC